MKPVEVVMVKGSRDLGRVAGSSWIWGKRLRVVEMGAMMTGQDKGLSLYKTKGREM